MGESRRGDGDGPADAGFSLPVVLWSLLLVSLLLLGFIGTAQTTVRIAANGAANAEAAALSEAGIWLAVRDLASVRLTGAPGRFAVPGAPAVCDLDGGATITLLVEDEAGKVDINLAEPDLLQRLLTGLGASRAEASALADRILDYRDADRLRRLNGAEAPEYERAGLDHGPADAPFASTLELGHVAGMSEALLERLLPLVTVDSTGPGFDPARAPPDLLRALLPEGRFATRLSPAALAPETLGLPEAWLARSRGDVLSIRSTARLAGGAVSETAAVIALTGRRERPYSVKRWLGRKVLQPRSLADPVRIGPC